MTSVGKRLRWNRELYRLVMWFGIVFAVCIGIMNIGMGVYLEKLRREHKVFLSVIFENISATYPDVDEEEFVKVLSGRVNTSQGEEILARYGVFQEYGRESFSVLERQVRSMSVFSNILLSVFFLIVSVFLLLYLKRRQLKIYGLETYMEMLYREGYLLDIEDNSDDELSGLRNEIYKLTVLLKEQAVRAAEQKKALADSMADISHQLKTPLTSMTVLMDNLADDIDMDPAIRRHFITEITYQLTNMSWLVSTLLKISRLDAGVVELDRESLEVASLVGEALQKVEVAAEWNQVSFALKIPEDAVLVADRKWTAEALANILKNAVEHSPRDAVVEISAEENDVYTGIFVRDRGKGIGEEERKKLFNRFYRGTSAREDSVGIGLALAKEIIEKQKGYVSVESERDKGTCFAVKFLK